MKIKKLIIHNISSIEDATIDFEDEKLLTEPIFLISGPTGSGKTTILDAICLALFKKTPRTESANNEDIFPDIASESRNTQDKKNIIRAKSHVILMRRGCVECLSDLYFTGEDQNEYLAHWGVKRSRLKANGKLQKEEYVLTNLTTNKIYTKNDEIKEQLDKCIKINFEQFLRTCLLAQGEFKRFLNSKDDEKSDILEKLTGTEIYSRIGQNIYRISKEKTIELENKKGILNNLSLLSNEEKQLLEEEQAEKQKLITEINKENAILNDQINYLRIRNNIKEQIISHEKELTDVGNVLNSENFKLKSRLCELYIQTQDVRSRLKDYNSYKKELNIQTNEATKFKNEYLILSGGLRYAQEKLQTLQKSNADIERKIKKGGEKLQILQEESKKYDYNQLSNQLKEFSSHKDKLNSLKNAFNLHKEQQKNYNVIVENIEKTKNEIERLLNNREKLQRAKQEAENNYEKIKASLDDFAKAVRRKLHKGDICPVCGSKIIEVFTDEKFETIAKPLEEKKIATQQAYEDWNASYKSKDSLLRTYNQERVKIENALKSYRSELTKILLSLNLDQNIELTQELISQMNLDTEKTIENSNIKLKNYAIITKQIREQQNSLADINRILNQINLQISLVKDCETYKKEIDSILKKWDTAVKSQNVDNLKEKWNVFSQNVRFWQQKILSLRDLVAKDEQWIEQYFAKNPNILRKEVENLMQNDENKMQLAALEIQNVKENYLKIQSIISNDRENILKIEQEKPEIEEDATIEEKLLNQQANINSLTEYNLRLGVIKQTLSNNEKNEETYKKQQIQIENLQKEVIRWQNFSDIFGSADGSKLKRIAQGFILGDLLNKANNYLRKFTDRFVLTSQNNSLTILIQDNFEGKVLSGCASLSGGESFMVSLALALGLADTSGAKAFSDILFIDEGFGTLSSEYLEIVINTLSNLHDINGRRVGIISHVSQLRERIAAQILLKPVNNTKSIVEIELH